MKFFILALIALMSSTAYAQTFERTVIKPDSEVYTRDKTVSSEFYTAEGSEWSHHSWQVESAAQAACLKRQANELQAAVKNKRFAELLALHEIDRFDLVVMDNSAGSIPDFKTTYGVKTDTTGYNHEISVLSLTAIINSKKQCIITTAQQMTAALTNKPNNEKLDYMIGKITEALKTAMADIVPPAAATPKSADKASSQHKDSAPETSVKQAQQKAAGAH